MDNYIKITVSKYDEGLMALMSLLPFESFEDIEETMICYIKQDALNEDAQKEMEGYLNMFGCTYVSEIIPPQNWNAVWESNFDPVEVDDFCRIRADFHDSSDEFDFELTIHPKMAFGTGHHETTHMMIQQMRHLDFVDKSVFDYGCGTGVLAILAELLGATKVYAIDIEQPSYESTVENAQINQATLLKAGHGDISLAIGNKYDIILANINRNVLLASVDQLSDMLNNSGILLLSGILEEDEDLILDAYEFAGFKYLDTKQRGKWLCIKMIKNSNS